jgi:hypothetical protein
LSTKIVASNNGYKMLMGATWEFDNVAELRSNFVFNYVTFIITIKYKIGRTKFYLIIQLDGGDIV